MVTPAARCSLAASRGGVVHIVKRRHRLSGSQGSHRRAAARAPVCLRGPLGTSRLIERGEVMSCEPRETGWPVRRNAAAHLRPTWHRHAGQSGSRSGRSSRECSRERRAGRCTAREIFCSTYLASLCVKCVKSQQPRTAQLTCLIQISIVGFQKLGIGTPPAWQGSVDVTLASYTLCALPTNTR